MRKPSAPPVVRPAIAQKPVPVVSEPDDDAPEPEIDETPSSDVTAERVAPTAAAIATPVSTPTAIASTPSAPMFVPPPAAESIGPELDGDAEDVDMSAGELDVLFEGDEAGIEEPAPKPKYALPRPKPVKSKASEFGQARSESGASPRRSTPPPLSGNVPKGIRPPAAGAKRPEDTDVIIAALGAELMDDEPAAGESVEAPAAPAVIMSSVPRVSPASRSFAADGAPIDDDDLELHGKRPPWMWIAAGALAAVVVAVVAFAGGDDEAEQAAITRSGGEGAYSASMSAENEKDGGQAKPVVAARREAPTGRGDADAPTVAAAGDAVVGEAAEIEEVEVAEAEADAAIPAEPPPEPAPTAELPAAEPTPVADTGGGRHHKRKHRNRHQQRTVASAAPPPSSSSSAPAASKGDASADQLLASAKKALASGNNASAYSLAAKARRLEKTNEALQIMAKAGCRMGSENKAKAAFANLPFGMKAGVRSECRAKGIRLGL